MAKQAILHRLEPLTRKYYTHFKYCAGCDQVYWAGSHRERMQELIAALDLPETLAQPE